MYDCIVIGKNKERQVRMTTNLVKDFGCNTWWTIPETSVDAIKAQGILVKHGFEATDLKAPTRHNEASRAAHSFQNRRGKTNRRVTESVKTDGTDVGYGILDREQK